MKPKKTEKARTGPEPECLKIQGDWRDMVKLSLNKKKPKRGWPKPKK